MNSWRPKRTFKDIINDYGNEITSVDCSNDEIKITIKLKYDDIPEEIANKDLIILVNKLNETGGDFTIVPRAKYVNN